MRKWAERAMQTNTFDNDCKIKIIINFYWLLAMFENTIKKEAGKYQFETIIAAELFSWNFTYYIILIASLKNNKQKRKILINGMN